MPVAVPLLASLRAFSTVASVMLWYRGDLSGSSISCVSGTAERAVLICSRLVSLVVLSGSI